MNRNSEFLKFLFGFERCLKFTDSADDSSSTNRQTE